MFEEQRHQYEARFYRAKNRFSLQCTFCQPIWPHHRLATLPLLHRSLLLIRMYIMLWSRAIFHADLVNISYMCPRYSWRAKLCSFFPPHTFVFYRSALYFRFLYMLLFERRIGISPSFLFLSISFTPIFFLWPKTKVAICARLWINIWIKAHFHFALYLVFLVLNFCTQSLTHSLTAKVL